MVFSSLCLVHSQRLSMTSRSLTFRYSPVHLCYYAVVISVFSFYIFMSRTDPISLLLLFLFFLFGVTLFRKAQGSIVSNGIGMKFGRSVYFQVNVPRLTESDGLVFGFDCFKQFLRQPCLVCTSVANPLEVSLVKCAT